MNEPKKQKPGVSEPAEGDRANAPVKKTYAAPKLADYGNLTQITRGSSGALGDKGSKKT